MHPIPPVAPKRPYPITQHGQTRVDDYFWLRYRDDPQTIPYLQAENAYLEATLAHTTTLQAALVEEMKARIPEADQSAPLRSGDYIYYTRIEPGQQYPLYCRRQAESEGPEEILLDQNLLAEGQPYCGLGAFEPSPDHTKLAYLLDVEGGETYTLYIKDLQTGQLYPEAISNTLGYSWIRMGLAWAQDSQTLYYLTLDETHRPYRVYRHRLGDDPAQDILVYEETETRCALFIRTSRSGAYLWVLSHTNSSDEARLLPLWRNDGELRLLIPRRELIEYTVEHQGDRQGNGRLLFLTNDGAQNFRLLASPANGPLQLTELLPERPDVTLEGVFAFEQALVITERQDGLERIRLSAPDGLSAVRYVPMPEAAYSISPDANLNAAAPAFRFVYTSLVTPRTTVDYNLARGEWQVVKQVVIPSGYDARLYATERVYAPAPDGKQVPVSLVYRQDLKQAGGSPLLLYGYGSYGASMDPTFEPNRLSLLDRGVIFAIAHVRGGADLGRAWYEDGRLLNKRNTFTDFIACAEHLIAQGYSRKETLAIMGRSAGGLLVGAVMTMRPDLCQALVAGVPFVDVVNSMSDPTIPLTTGEYDQWGNPDEREYFDYMMSYSPYDNLRPAAYPHILLTTGLNDPRVAFWEPAKFTAKLRTLKTNDTLTLLHTEFGAGHGGASGRYNALKEVALTYAFILECIADAPRA